MVKCHSESAPGASRDQVISARRRPVCYGPVQVMVTRNVATHDTGYLCPARIYQRTPDCAHGDADRQLGPESGAAATGRVVARVER
jgi:hypothetical protein